MLVPFDISIVLSFFAFIAGALVGVALCRREDATVSSDLKPQVLAYAHEVERLEAPRLVEWTPELRARFRYQQEHARQIAAARRTA